MRATTPDGHHPSAWCQSYGTSTIGAMFVSDMAHLTTPRYPVTGSHH